MLLSRRPSARASPWQVYSIDFKIKRNLYSPQLQHRLLDARPPHQQEATMPFEEVKKIWMNGRLVDFADAKIHILTHVIHYGSGLFEGIRCYNTKNQGTAIFRLDAHTRRLYDSCKIYRMEVPIPMEQFKKACIDTVAANDFEDCYLRPVVYR